MFKLLIILLTLLFINTNCDHGIAPPEEGATRNGITGTITYQNWPPADSLFDLRLVIFKNYPPADIVGEVLAGNAIVHPPLGGDPLPFNTDSTTFDVQLNPGIYEYVVAAQQYGEDMMADWRAVGQYDTTGTGLDAIPTPIQVFSDSVLTNININVDFNNLPVQPF